MRRPNIGWYEEYKRASWTLGAATTVQWEFAYETYGKESGIDWRWNRIAWMVYLKRKHHAENFEPHHGYVQTNTPRFIRDSYLWRSDGMDCSIVCGRVFVYLFMWLWWCWMWISIWQTVYVCAMLFSSWNDRVHICDYHHGPLSLGDPPVWHTFWTWNKNVHMRLIHTLSASINSPVLQVRRIRQCT